MEKIVTIERFILDNQPETAIGEITDSCHPAEIGTKLIPFVPEPVPLARRTAMRPVNVPEDPEVIKAGGTIVHIDFNIVSFAEGNVVYIDRGAAQNRS